MLETKICNICHEVKDCSLFHKRSRGKDGLDNRCKDCIRKRYLKNRAVYLERSKEQRLANPESYKKYLQEYSLKNSEKIRVRASEYYYTNKSMVLKKANEYSKKKRQTNPEFKKLCVLRNRVGLLLKSSDKSGKAVEIIGCSVLLFREHIKSLFKEGMNWENYGKGEGKWSLDHIKPCCKFNLLIRAEQLLCFHYKNTQPLWWIDNIKKVKK